MDKTIVAFFNTIDGAEFGARSVKRGVNNVKEIKIKYQTVPGEEKYPVFSNHFVPNGMETPIAENGMIPAVTDTYELGADVVSLDSDNDYSVYKAKVEVRVDGENAKKAIAKLRANGGYTVKVF